MNPKDEAYLKNEKILNLLTFYNQDIFLPSRTIFIGCDNSEGEAVISADQTSYIIKGMHILENEDPEKDITIILNSSGGDEYHGWGIYDVIRASPCRVTIKAVGQCMSMGTIILQAADVRLAYPNTSFLVHNGSVGFVGDAEKAISEAKEVERLIERMYEVYMEATGLSKAKIKAMCQKESYMGAKEALKIGLIDSIIPLP